MTTLVFIFEYDKGYVQELFIEHGTLLASEMTLHVEATDLTVEERHLLSRMLDGEICGRLWDTRVRHAEQVIYRPWYGLSETQVQQMQKAGGGVGVVRDYLRVVKELNMWE